MKNRNRLLGIVLSLVLTMTICAGCGGSDVGSGATADVTVGSIEGSAMAGDLYLGRIKWDFNDSDGNSYEGVISGLVGGKNLDEESMSYIVDNISAHYAGGSTALVEEGESYTLVDAEKYGGKDNSSKSSGTPYGDANLCWAASTADMLKLSGWSDGMSEDEILSEFTEAYFDDGAYQDTGIKYFLNGMNIDQSAAEKAGKDGARNAVFVDNESSDLLSSTQVRHPGDNNGKLVNPGHYNDTAAENVFAKYDTSKYEVADLEKTIIHAIDNDDAVGISIVFYNGDSRVGVHALTITGYIKDSDGKLVALIIADSDNDIELKTEYGDSAESTLTERRGRANTYTMYLTGSFSHLEHEYITLSDYKFSNPKMKYDNAVVQQITVIKNAANAGVVSEIAGTCDAANTPDIILRNASDADVETNITVNAGDKVDIPFVVGNRSYKGYSAKDKATVKCKYYVFKDGKKIDEAPFDFKLVTSSYTTGEANCNFSITASYKFKQAGVYTVDVAVLGVYSGNKKLDEAYTSNNYLKDALKVTVK